MEKRSSGCRIAAGLRLLGDAQLRALRLALLELRADRGRDARLCHAHGDDLDARSVRAAVALERLLEPLVDLVEERDCDLVQRVPAAELVDLVVHLVKDPRLVVARRVVGDGLARELGAQAVDDLDLSNVITTPPDVPHGIS